MMPFEAIALVSRAQTCMSDDLSSRNPMPPGVHRSKSGQSLHWPFYYMPSGIRVGCFPVLDFELNFVRYTSFRLMFEIAALIKPTRGRSLR